MKADFLEEAALLTGLKGEEGLGPEEMRDTDVLGGKDPVNKGVRECGAWAAEPELGEQQMLGSDGKSSLPFSLSPVTEMQVYLDNVLGAGV